MIRSKTYRKTGARLSSVRARLAVEELEHRTVLSATFGGADHEEGNFDRSSHTAAQESRAASSERDNAKSKANYNDSVESSNRSSRQERADQEKSKSTASGEVERDQRDKGDRGSEKAKSDKKSASEDSSSIEKNGKSNNGADAQGSKEKKNKETDPQASKDRSTKSTDKSHKADKGQASGKNGRDFGTEEDDDDRTINARKNDRDQKFSESDESRQGKSNGKTARILAANSQAEQAQAQAAASPQARATANTILATERPQAPARINLTLPVVAAPASQVAVQRSPVTFTPSGVVSALQALETTQRSGSSIGFNIDGELIEAPAERGAPAPMGEGAPAEKPVEEQPPAPKDGAVPAEPMTPKDKALQALFADESFATFSIAQAIVEPAAGALVTIDRTPRAMPAQVPCPASSLPSNELGSLLHSLASVAVAVNLMAPGYGVPAFESGLAARRRLLR